MVLKHEKNWGKRLMLVYSKELIIDTDDFPAIFITPNDIYSDKYSIVFNSKFSPHAGARLKDLEYDKALEVLREINEGIIHHKQFLKLSI